MDIESDDSQISMEMSLSNETENVTRWVMDQDFRQDQERLNIPFDPSHWSELHVKHWLHWAVEEFHLQEVDVGAFNFSGEQLFTMSHPVFVQHIPHDPGDLFWTHLELLRKCKFVAVLLQPMNAGTVFDMDRGYDLED